MEWAVGWCKFFTAPKVEKEKQQSILSSKEVSQLFHQLQIILLKYIPF